jgi:methyltransferase (TIGR00027 family)
MPLPDLSNSLYVARLRFIQTIHEAPPRQNPDVLVQKFLPPVLRMRARWMRARDVEKLRSDPFYDYLIARTQYYDRIFSGACEAGVHRIVNIGCGSDTRPYRFQSLLRDKRVQVLECDQQDSIVRKRAIVKEWPGADHVSHLVLDINERDWPNFGSYLRSNPTAKTLVMMEGVSPYIDTDNFVRFLAMLASELAPGSEVAYDFKLAGVKDDFGGSERTRHPFRLTSNRSQLEDFHGKCGLQVKAFETGAQLCKRLLGEASISGERFNEDALLRLNVASAP